MRRTLVIWLLMFGCDKGDSSLGGLPEADSSSSGSADDDGASASMTGSGDESPAGGVGDNCELAGVPETHLLELDNSGCASGMCLYPDDIIAGDETCDEDSDCSGVGRGIRCNLETSECELDPAHVAARSMCTDFCEVDADCQGVAGTACEGGFQCIPVTALGPVCCQKVCVCGDDAEVSSLQEACEAGTQPGCCDQEPLPDACG